MAQTYNFPDHESGDTFDGVTFEVKVNNAPLDLTDADIVATFSGGYDIYIFSKSNGKLTVINAAEGKFSLQSQIINLPPARYSYEIKFTLSSGLIKTYIEGTWNITE